MKIDRPKVSVIIPSYNNKKYIKQCVDSVLSQTLNEIEILCIDAGSTDGTLEILKQYAHEETKLNVFLSNKKSYGKQVNHGISIANGEYVAIVESDDYIKVDMYESLYNLTRYKHADIIKSTFYHIYNDDEKEKQVIDTAKRNLETNTIFNVLEQPLFLEGHPSIWSAIYKKSFLVKKDIRFNEEEGAAWVDNPFFYETALKAETIIYSNVAYYCYRETNEESSTNKPEDLSIPARRINDMFQVLDECDCTDRTIREMLYKRLFRYIEITMKNSKDNTDNLDYNTCKAINEAVAKIDDEYVHTLSNRQKQYYYKFRSPLILSKFIR